MTYDEMYDYCAKRRDSDGFCRCNSSCSGPSYCNRADIIRNYEDMKLDALLCGAGGCCVFPIDGVRDNS